MVEYESGRYFCRVTNQAIGKAGTGNPQVIIRFQVVGKFNTPTEYDLVASPKERTMFLTITDKTAERVGNDLERLGFTGSSFRQVDPNAAGYCNLTGAEFEGWCKHEEYLGNMNEKWSVAKQGGGMPEMQALSPKELRDLDNLFGKHLKKVAKQSAPASRPAQSSPEPPVNDAPIDDCPF